MEASPDTVRVIEPQRGWRFPDLREVWAYRDLLYFLARRDIVVRYKQAIVGVTWAILQPLVLAAVFTLFIGLYAKVPSEADIPYGLFVVTGLVVWLAFSGAVQGASESTVMSEALISKTYFPRIVIPVAAIAPAAVDFLFGFVVVFGITLAYGFTPGLAILAVPAIILLTVMTALGAGLWLSALNVKYRDVHLAVPLIILVGLFMTPVMYPADLVPATVEPFYAINPMVGVVESFRWALLGTDWPGVIILIPIATSVLLLITGAFYFQRAEREFADVI